MKRRYDVLYAIGAVVSSPVLAFGLLKTGKWRTDWRGRFGRAPALPDDSRPTLLLHGVSVGEINATRELVARLTRPDSPPVRLVISATTNTGFDRAQELYGDRHPVVRFPFDFSWMVGRFLDRLRPRAVALMELEVWPNLAQECLARGIPLVVINGRLSDSSFGTYRWARRWVRPMFRDLTAVAAQTEEYAQRFRELGTPPDRISVTDTMKWDTVTFTDDVAGAAELAAAMGVDPSRPLVVAGSTGDGEEELLIRERPDGVQLMLVPRKPERFDEVARLAPGIVRRSLQPDGSPDPAHGIGGEGRRPSDLFLLDTMGELTKAYALADVAVVGRSLVALGGSDPIEPVALGKPTLIGPRHENFREVVAALESGGGLRVTDQPMAAALELLANKDEARKMAEAGRRVIRERQGATERHASLLLGLLGGVEGSGGSGTAGPGGEGSTGRGAGGVGERGEDPNRRTRGRPVRRALLLLFLLYMATGYMTTAVRRVEVSEAAAPVLPLPSLTGTLASGVFSVHTWRSHDAWGTRDQVGKAGEKAGLDFVVLGDHPPDPRRPDWEVWGPEFFHGVLVDGGVEMRGPAVGKVVVMGVDSTFKRWQGDMDSFVQFLHSQGATSLIVHGRGPRESERWEHDRIQGFQGWEVLDISENARARLKGPWGLYHLVTLLVGWPVGLADEAFLHLMREGFQTATVAAYDSVWTQGRLTATAGLNTHPKLKLGPVLFPSYNPFFRTLVAHVAVDAPLAGDPAVGGDAPLAGDAPLTGDPAVGGEGMAGPLSGDPVAADDALRAGIEGGNLFISLGDAEAARGFRFGGVADGGPVLAMGDVGAAGPGAVLRAGFQIPPHRKVVYRVYRDGRPQGWFLGPELEWPVPGPGSYRVEVFTYGARLGRIFFRWKPWIFANPVGVMAGSPGDLLGVTADAGGDSEPNGDSGS